MRKIILLFLIQVSCSLTGLAQRSPWKASGEVVPERPDLIVHWQDSTKFPRKVWVYQLLPDDFSPQIVSNLMSLCSFTAKDETESRASGMTFQSADRTRTLSISFSSGEIEYTTPEISYSLTNLAVGVPPIDQLPTMATNFLGELHINFSDITDYFGTNKIDYVEPTMTLFYLKGTIVTNIPYRTILFKRAVDGVRIAFENNRISIGEHGKISAISIYWPNLKRVRSYPVVSREEVIHFLRTGDAVRGPATTDIGDFDWSSVKSLTITDAIPSYLVSDDRLYPFLYLGTLIDLGGVQTKIGMACPLFDETQH